MKFTIQAPDGLTFTLEGDSEPTKEQLDRIHSQLSSQMSSASDNLEINPNSIKYGDLSQDRASSFNKMSDYIKGVLNFSVNKTEQKPEMTGALDRLTTFDIKEAKEKPEGVAVAEEFTEAFKGMEGKISAGEIGKSLGRAGLRFVSSTSEGLSAIGDWMVDTEKLPDSKPRELAGKSLRGLGDLIKSLSDKGLESKLLEKDEDIYSGTFAENPSYMRVLDFMSDAYPSLAAGMGMKAVGLGKTGAALLALGDSAEVYWDAKAAGKTSDEAFALYATSTGISTALEYKGIDTIMKGSGVIKSAVSEGLTEMLQQGVAINLVKKLGFDDTIDVMEGVIEAGILGCIGGGTAGGVVSLGEASKRSYSRVRDILAGKGYNEQQTNTIIEETARLISEYPEAVNKKLQENIDRNINVLNERVQNMTKDEAEIFKKEMTETQMEVSYKIHKANPEFTPEQVVELSNIVSNSVYAMSIIEGVSPKQVALPEIIKTTEEQFMKDLKDKKVNFNLANVIGDKQMALNKGDIDESNQRKTLINEMQQAIDETDGDLYSELEKKYGTEIAENMYARLSGETKAINVEERNDLTSEEKKSRSLLDTQGIPSAEQDVKFSRAKGAYINGNIYLFENADVATVMHEFMHHWGEQLKGMNTASSNRMLSDIDTWTRNEFVRKYNLQQVGQKWRVVDKKGNVVYDNAGKRFATDQDAVSYALDELFAQGFEQYLSEGRAPSKKLERAFKAFYSWMKDVFAKTGALDIQLTPEMTQVYADLLGGASVDTFLNKPIEEFIQERKDVQEIEQEMHEEQKEEVQDPIHFQELSTAQQEMNAYELLNLKDAGEIGEIEKSIASLSRLAKNVSQKLNVKMRMHEYRKRLMRNKYKARCVPFFDALNMIRKDSPADFEVLKHALLNCDSVQGEVNEYKDTIREILGVYGALDTIIAVDEVLEDIYSEAKKAGIELDYRKDFYPRLVKDYKKFYRYTRKGGYSQLDKAIEDIEKRTNSNLTMEQRVEFINNNLHRQANMDAIRLTSDPYKRRSIRFIDSTMQDFYADPTDSIMRYIDGMVGQIENAKILGYSEENVRTSIGQMIDELISSGDIHPKDKDIAIDVVKHALVDVGVKSPKLKFIRDAGYIVTMGQFSTAVTQLDDFSAAWHNAGFRNALKAVFSAKSITMEDAQLDEIGKEFSTVEGLSKYVEKLFKTTGLTKLDSWLGNTFMQAEYERISKISEDELVKEIERDELTDNHEEAVQLAKELQAKENTDMTGFYYFNKISDYRPTSRFEMPVYYKGNSRIWYQLKSFTIKRLDLHAENLYAIKNLADKASYEQGLTGFKDVASAVLSTKEGRSAVTEAVKNELRLCAILMLCGMSKDALIDLLYGRKVDMEDSVVNNFWGLFGLNKYFVWRAKEYGTISTAESFVMQFPVGNVVDTLSKDLLLYSQEYKTGKKKGQRKREFKNFDTLKYVPIVGGIYYWYLGRGAEKKAKDNKTEKKKLY